MLNETSSLSTEGMIYAYTEPPEPSVLDQHWTRIRTDA